MKSLDWEMLPFFLAVARAGSLRSGARVLNTNYGTVNRNIQALEASYGVQLFQRSRRGFSLTDAGLSLLPLAEQAELTVNRARKQIEGLDKAETGKIKFSLPHMLAYDIVAPIIARFQKAYPDIRIKLRLTSEVEDINRAQTDVSLRAAHEVTGDVVARKLYHLVFGVYASQSYISEAVPQAGSDGGGLTWIGWTRQPNLDSWLAQSPFPRARFHHMTTEGYMQVSLLRNGCGMSYLPVFFEKLYPELGRLPGTDLIQGPALWIVLHSDLQKTVRVRRFVDFLAAEFIKLKPDIQGELFQK